MIIRAFSYKKVRDTLIFFFRFISIYDCLVHSSLVVAVDLRKFVEGC